MSRRIAQIISVACVFVFASCAPAEPPPTPSAAVVRTETPHTRAETDLFGADPDGEEWFLSDAWLSATPCLAKAQLLYVISGERLRGRSLEAQLQDFTARTDLGTNKSRLIESMKTALKDVYAVTEASLSTLPAEGAANCIAATPQVGVNEENALRCFLAHQAPMMQALYQTSPPKPQTGKYDNVDREFHFCLRGASS